MNLKRDLVKYVRDKAKSQYKKTSSCYICGSTTDLDFHHYYGLTELLETWIKQNKIIINSEQDILDLRESFIDENRAKCMSILLLFAIRIIYGCTRFMVNDPNYNSTKTKTLGRETERKIWHGIIDF
jgi:hypothetical protein